MGGGEGVEWEGVKPGLYTRTCTFLVIIFYFLFFRTVRSIGLPLAIWLFTFSATAQGQTSE